MSEPLKVTKLSSTTVSLSSSSWAPPAPPAPAPAPPRTNTSDPLHVAAQAYPWSFMSSTLDACFQSAEKTATTDLETRATELSAEEAEIADQRDRLEAERAIKFYDELGSDVTQAPEIMQLFHTHGDACAKIETDALKLAAKGTPDPEDKEPLKPYTDMLEELEKLQTQATDLQNSINKLNDDVSSTTKATPAESKEDAVTEEKEDTPATETEPSAREHISGVFLACLPVLRARIANLNMAQDLVDSALENASLGLRMASMGIAE